VSYVVRSGDTLYQLSQTSGVSVSQLQQANCLSSSMIYAGKQLYLPPWSVPANDPTSTPTTTPSSIPTVIGTATPSEIETASPTATPSSTQASVLTATPSSTPTDIPNATISSTATALPTSTASNTPAPTAIPTSETPQFAYNQPGSYDFSGRCGQISIPFRVGEDGQPYPMTVDMCVFRVDVMENGEMLFNLVWTAHIPGGGNYFATKGSDVGNLNMNVTDNLGNRYDHIALYGIAGQDAALRDGQSGYGSYLFPAAQPGASSFTFHDDDQAIAIGDIVLARRQ
jgi:LysM repeat protein